jgi:rhodanese-related sulfurtransferase
MTDLMLSLADFTADPDRYMPIDVRDEAEFLERHIPGAINVPLSTLQSGGLIAFSGKVPVTVCGKGGGRSADAAARLRAMGFHAVWLEGGTIRWFEEMAS